VQTYIHAVIQTCTDKVCLIEEDIPNKDTNIWKLQMLHIKALKVIFTRTLFYSIDIISLHWDTAHIYIQGFG